jgi:hypothetical protein
VTVSLNRPDKDKWIFLFGLWALHGGIAFWQFAALPSDNHNFLIGLSSYRVFLGGLLLSWIVINFVLIISVSRKSALLYKFLDLLKNPFVRDAIFVTGILAVILRVWLAILEGLFKSSASFRYVAYIDRLSPLLDLMAFVFLEIILLVLFFIIRNWTEYRKSVHVFLVRILSIELVFGFVGLFIYFTDLGIAQGNKGDWSRGLPAVPLLEWQIILACLFCLGMVVVESREKIIKTAYLERWVCLAIWLFTVGLWLGQPVIPNASALRPHEPNFEIYPFIDAQVYDEYAQSVLIGNGFGANEIPQRPLYIVFLAFIHILVGQDYRNVIALQSLILAIFPVLLYLFGREFFGRPIGISIALLAVLRDYTSNLVSPFTGNLSYSKLYLSELPTAMLLVLFLLVGMRWIKSGFPIFLGFLMGGVLGVAMLIRTQVVVALPVILFFALIAQPKKILPMIKGALFAFVTIVVVISPWLWRNWNITGELIFDNPGSQIANLALRYSRLNGVEPNIMPLPGESNSDYNDRLKKIALDSFSSNPRGVINGVVNSFLNHAVNNVLLFPLRNDLKDFGELWTPTDAFWEKWEGRPTGSQSLLLVFYITLFGLGVAAAWFRNGWLGFLPLGLNLVYNLWTSLALISGQRFMLTMDWSIYLYYMIGLFTLISVFLFAMENGRSIVISWVKSNLLSITQAVVDTKWWQYMIAGTLFFGVGISLLLIEIVFPVRYPIISRDQILNNLISSPSLNQSNISPACLQDVVNEHQLSVSQGRAIYPRYYIAGDGERFTDAVGYKVVDEGRLVFDMVGQINGRVIFPMSQSPDFFPNAADVTLISDNTGKPWFILIKQGDVERFYTSASIGPTLCETQ